jgi:hypothetical protein
MKVVLSIMTLEQDRVERPPPRKGLSFESVALIGLTIPFHIPCVGFFINRAS